MSAWSSQLSLLALPFALTQAASAFARMVASLCEATMRVLRDLKEMPTKSRRAPSNGMDSVSRGLVWIEHLRVGDYAYRAHHGAMLQVGSGMWRGAGCGAWDPDYSLGILPS